MTAPIAVATAGVATGVAAAPVVSTLLLLSTAVGVIVKVHVM